MCRMLNHLENLMTSLEQGSNEIHVDGDLGRQAMVPLQRMLGFREKQLSGD